jgi:hypothetical protein
VDVTDIKNQQLGLVLDNFYVCQNCHIVDNDHDRIEIGHTCSNCGKPSSGGRSYFGLKVDSLITLMQEFYHSKQLITNEFGEVQDLKWIGNVKLPVIIFFATLREVLLDNLLQELFLARGLPEDICDRLLADSPTYKQRLDKLFRALTGEKWKNALKIISEEQSFDFIALNDFVGEIVNARNTFLHTGIKWAIKEEMAEQCLRNIYPLLSMYTILHNKYVVKYHKSAA